MPRELSLDRETALEQIAKGWGREPTTAHPDCICGRAEYCEVGYGEIQGETHVFPRSHWPKTVPCPVHPKRR